MGTDSKSLKAKRFCVNLLTGVAILLAVGTAFAWFLSSKHPWSTCVEFVNLDAHGRFGTRNATWQIRWFKTNGEPYTSWAWSISGDEDKLDVEPRYSFYEWKIPWWKIILLWLVVPILRFSPWRSIGCANTKLEDARGPYEWLLFKSTNRLVPRGRDIKNVLVAHCLASYLTALVIAIFLGFQLLIHDVGEVGFDRNDIMIIAMLFFLAPLTVPCSLLTSMLYRIDPLSVGIAGIYLIAGFAWYLRRTNRLIAIQIVQRVSTAS
jgi:hypothetical protein